MAKVDDIFKRQAERNREINREIGQRTPPKRVEVDYEAMDAEEREERLKQFEQE